MTTTPGGSPAPHTPTDEPEGTTDAAGSAASPLPWKGKATRTDKALMWAIGGAMLFMLVLWPLRPFMIASAPVLLSLATGSKAAIGAVAAFAEAGRYPIWLAVVAGVVGMAKLDWLFWWTGRQWGSGFVGFFSTGERAERLALRLRSANRWILGLLVVFARIPGVPSALVYGTAGWAGMGLGTFLALDLLGALLITGLVVAAGYALGERAIDLIVTIDEYALWVSIAIVIGMVLLPSLRSRSRSRARDTEEPRD
ncbi:DedA family protein [Nocardiopsis sp. N85]|uniref:DedA family protein n=1 Tax=Nocardiopsis sp. N85 TaxID=3029400 RepID=UPI00237F4DD5|nr:DedA family protein [Nocardiopsis sp. N85]MDE3723115.1 DedA family protein [Nocardiopsis sp. N85]